MNRFGEENQGLGFGSLKLEAEIWRNTKTGQLHTGQEQKKCVKYHRKVREAEPGEKVIGFGK